MLTTKGTFDTFTPCEVGILKRPHLVKKLFVFYGRSLVSLKDIDFLNWSLSIKHYNQKPVFYNSLDKMGH